MKARKARLMHCNIGLCPKCGGNNVGARTFSDTVDFRGIALDVEGLQENKCTTCSHVWSSEEQIQHNNALIRTAYGAARDRLRAVYGLLSGEQIAQIRESLGLNQKVAATLFGGGANAFNKYESGEVLQSFAMDRLLRLAKIIGEPVVRFLSDVNAPAPFRVVSTAISSANVMMSFASDFAIYKSGWVTRGISAPEVDVSQYLWREEGRNIREYISP